MEVPLHRRLIEPLNDTREWSASALAAYVGALEHDVSDALTELRARGVALEVVGESWRLQRPVELLDKRKIVGPIGRVEQLILLDTTDSTNAHLLRAAPQVRTACLAEWQSAGRARRGRGWVSPYGANIPISISLRWTQSWEQLQGLSIAVGVAVVDALEGLGLNDCGLKWPNDVQHARKKICGILVETTASANANPLVVVGVGLNTHLGGDAAAANIDQPWTSVEAVLGRRVSRNSVAVRLLSSLDAALDDFVRSGLDTFQSRWAASDVLAGQTVQARSADGEIIGTAQGIDSVGALRLRVDGNMIRITSGEVTVRPVTNP